MSGLDDDGPKPPPTYMLMPPDGTQPTETRIELAGGQVLTMKSVPAGYHLNRDGQLCRRRREVEP
jgi:hypothetical protein